MPATKTTPARTARPPLFRAALVAAGILVAGAVGFALWQTRSVPVDPFARQTADVLALGEGTAAAVALKLNRVVALIALLPEDDARRAELEGERERLTNLEELFQYVERLDALLVDARSAAAGSEQALRAARDAENLWVLMREYRRQYAGDDPGALAVVDRGRGLLSEIGDATGSERLLELAEQP